MFNSRRSFSNIVSDGILIVLAILLPKKGLEPLLFYTKLEPKPSVSTSSTILAFKKMLVIGLEPIFYVRIRF
jgi:hypothetical protein